MSRFGKEYFMKRPYTGFVFGKEISISTPDSAGAYLHVSPLGISLTDSTVTFDVRACNDATIALMTDDISVYYVIVIGGENNTRQYIGRTGGFKTNEADVGSFPGLLDCVEYRTFWLSWQGGEIKVGSGHIVNDPISILANWTDPDPRVVKVLAIGTGFGSSGDWIFNKTYPAAPTTSGDFILTSSYTTCFNGSFHIYLTGKLIWTTNGVGRMECAMSCSRIDECAGFNFQDHTLMCELEEMGSQPVFNPTNEWNYFQKCNKTIVI